MTTENVYRFVNNVIGKTIDRNNRRT